MPHKTPHTNSQHCLCDDCVWARSAARQIGTAMLYCVIAVVVALLLAAAYNAIFEP